MITIVIEEEVKDMPDRFATIDDLRAWVNREDESFGVWHQIDEKDVAEHVLEKHRNALRQGKFVRVASAG